MVRTFLALISLWHLSTGQAQSLRGTSRQADSAVVKALFDGSNQSWGVQNFISCRYGVLCHGTEIEKDGKRMCDGTLTCRTDSATDASLGGNKTDIEMHDRANTTTAVANLLVCRYGSYCRGGWWYHYGRRECRGGIVCRHGPYYMGSDARDEGKDATLPLSSGDAHSSQDTALVALSPVEATYDPVNQSHGFSNLISCRFGVVCRGTWLWINGVRKCSGALVCKSSYKADVDVASQADVLDLGSNFTTVMQDGENTTSAVANLLVCRYGSYCRGGWWYHYGRRECRGGIVCRHGPYYMGSDASDEGKDATLPLSPVEAHSSQDTALVALSPVEATYDPMNQSHGFRNLISCRFGVVCRGTWLWINGVRKCSGALVCKSSYKADVDVASQADVLDLGSNFTTVMQDGENTTSAVANLLVCRYGSYCRGGWWYHYGRRECRGGIVCRHGPYYMGSDASDEGKDATLPLSPGEAHSSQDTALVALSPVEATYDPVNQSHGFSNLISCRFGVVCRGTWLWINGVRKCSGALVCKSGYKADVDVASQADVLDLGSNFTTVMQDGENTTSAVANLLVCRYGSYCRGGWWYHYGRRECRGGIVCRHGPYYMGSDASDEGKDHTLPLSPVEAHSSQDTALVALSPVEATYDPVNQSHGFSNLISCRFGVVCRGTWLWINGVRKCSGALVCKSGYKADVDVASQADVLDLGSNFTTVMQDAENTTSAVANLLVCRYGSYCRGGWWYHYGRRECRGGIVCRHGPYYMGSDASDEGKDHTLPLSPVEAHSSQDTALVALSPVEATYDPVNQSHGFSNLISCRFGVVCRGTWLWINGVRKCSGALVCKSGYKADVDVASQADVLDLGSNFTTVMQDGENTTSAVANLLVCRYGSYCRGGWWYHYGRRECRGGIVCRHGPYYMGSDASDEGKDATLPLSPVEAHSSQDTALVALSPVEATYDPVNQSHGFSNLISCRFGVVCRGTWLWINGVRKCSGALVCKSSYKADLDVASQADVLDLGSNFTTVMQDGENTTSAVANLLVCRYGSYCRGGWWYHYGRRECRGGIVCRHGPYYMGSDASDEGKDHTLPLSPVEAHSSQDTALVALSPVEATYDPVNQSHGFSNLISCRFGVVCRGTWLWINGVRKCSGALVCKSGYKADVDVASQADVLDLGSNFTTVMQDGENTTSAVANLLVCRYGSYCRGGWWYHYGRRECRGGIVCRSGPY